jgi:hypothetical protein
MEIGWVNTLVVGSWAHGICVIGTHGRDIFWRIVPRLNPVHIMVNPQNFLKGLLLMVEMEMGAYWSVKEKYCE